jgi:hypothetical protein
MVSSRQITHQVHLKCTRGFMTRIVNIAGYILLPYHKGHDEGAIPRHSANSSVQIDHSSSSQKDAMIQ